MMPDFEGFPVKTSLTEESLWPTWQQQIQAAWKTERSLIKREAKSRKVSRLCHFTLTRNLPSIYREGIKSRAELRESSIKHTPIDSSKKLYFEEFVYLSVTQPNTKMLYSKFINGSALAVVVVDVSALWKFPFFSIPTNSGSPGIPAYLKSRLHECIGLRGFQNLFSRNDLREEFQLRPAEPTDVQAELIFMESIPSSFFHQVLLTPIDKTSKAFLEIARYFDFFQTDSQAKYKWKILEEYEIKKWGPKYSPQAQREYNLRRWNPDWTQFDDQDTVST